MKPFLDALPLHDHSAENYATQLEQKTAVTQAEFAAFGVDAVEVYASPAKHYRMRAEFKIWQQDDKCHYVMFHPAYPKKPLKVDDFPVASTAINDLMPRLLSAVNNNDMLRKKLFQCEFLSSTLGECVITLIYHKPLDEQWQAEAQALKQLLGSEQLTVDIIGRSRKQKILLERDWISERFTVKDENFSYEHVEASFTQPNAYICEAMLNWAVTHSQNNGGDLLELYCGNGNFTLPLSRHFKRVLATEISKSSVNSAKRNMARNNVENIEFARLSSEEFTEALEGKREFRRLEHLDLASYAFSTVLVDPPRAGLDAGTRELIRRFDNILYISCSPETLQRDLQDLCTSHNVEDFALFDQFPFTPHRECGAVLKKAPWSSPIRYLLFAIHVPIQAHIQVVNIGHEIPIMREKAMKSITPRTPATYALTVFFCWLLLHVAGTQAGELNQNSTQKFGEYTVHYSAFNSTFLQPDIAANYGLVRANNQILINITVQNSKGDAIPAKLVGHTKNLMQQKKPLEFQTIEETYATYYMGAVRTTNEEVHHFEIDITPDNAETFTLKFTRKLYVEK